MGRGQNKPSAAKRLSAEARSFINGKSDKVTLHLDPTKIPKGPEYALQRAKGGGVHGKVGRDKHRAERKATRQALRSGLDD